MIPYIFAGFGVFSEFCFRVGFWQESSIGVCVGRMGRQVKNSSKVISWHLQVMGSICTLGVLNADECFSHLHPGAGGGNSHSVYKRIINPMKSWSDIHLKFKDMHGSDLPLSPPLLQMTLQESPHSQIDLEGCDMDLKMHC